MTFLLLLRRLLHLHRLSLLLLGLLVLPAFKCLLLIAVLLMLQRSKLDTSPSCLLLPLLALLLLAVLPALRCLLLIALLLMLQRSKMDSSPSCLLLPLLAVVAAASTVD